MLVILHAIFWLGCIPYECGLGTISFQVDSLGESPVVELRETYEEGDYIVELVERVAYAMQYDDENCQHGVDVGMGVHATRNWASSKKPFFLHNCNEKACS